MTKIVGDGMDGLSRTHGVCPPIATGPKEPVDGSRIGDAPVLPDLLNQIPADQQIGSGTAGGAYDTRKCYDAIAHRGAHAVIPPRKNAKPWKTITAGAVARNGYTALGIPVTTRLAKPEREKIILGEKACSALPPRGRLKEFIELSLQFLASPWNITNNGDCATRQTVLRLAFVEPLQYSWNKGHRTPEISFPFKVLERISGHRSKMVLLERIELSTSPLPRECSTSELQQPAVFQIATPGVTPMQAGSGKAL